MQNTKHFTQYSDIYFRISVEIDKFGNIHRKNKIYFYGKDSKEKRKKYRKKYYNTNKETIKRNSRKYYKDNKEKTGKRHKKYNKTNNGKESKRKSDSKRKNFGYNPLNNYFTGSQFHHIHIDNPGNGYFIPTELHNSVWHSYKNKKSMNKINIEVFKWLLKQI